MPLYFFPAPLVYAVLLSAEQLSGIYTFSNLLCPPEYEWQSWESVSQQRLLQLKKKLHINNLLQTDGHAARCVVQTDLLAKRTRTEPQQHIYQGHRCINE